MDTRSAGLATTALSFVVFILIARWYAAPWLRAARREKALAALLWVNAFRFVALELFSAQRAGLPIPDDLRDQIAYGDVAGATLAIVCIFALRRRSGAAIPLAWILAIATFIDLANALVGGIRNQMMSFVHDVPWLILCFYVPALWVTLALTVWQLVSRRGEELDAEEVAAT